MKLFERPEKILSDRINKIDEEIKRVRSIFVWQIDKKDYIQSLEDQKAIVNDLIETIKMIDFNFH